MAHNPKTIIPFSNGTEFMLWFDGQCEGCSRHGKEECRCPNEAALIFGNLTEKRAVRMGFSKDGNPPRKLKCFRKYKKSKTDTKTGELF